MFLASLVPLYLGKNFCRALLEQFLSGDSIDDIAEEYRVNCLMIEHVLRCEITLDKSQSYPATEESIGA